MTKAYEILIAPLPEDDGGGFIAVVPDLHGCMSDGATEEEALANIKDAIEAWTEAQKEMGRVLPEPGIAREAAMERDDDIAEALAAQQDVIEALQAKVAALQARITVLETSEDASATSIGMWQAYGFPRRERPSAKRRIKTH